jgi:hypothetical protein
MLGIATGGNQYGFGIAAVRHTQEMTRFSIGDMGNGTGI